MKSRKIGRINGTRKHSKHSKHSKQETGQKTMVKRGGKFTRFFRSFSKNDEENLDAIEHGEKLFGMKYGSYRSQIAQGLLAILDERIAIRTFAIKSLVETIKQKRGINTEKDKEDLAKNKKDQEILTKVKTYYTNNNIASAMANYAKMSNKERQNYDALERNYNKTRFFDYAIKVAEKEVAEKEVAEKEVAEKEEVHSPSSRSLNSDRLNSSSTTPLEFERRSNDSSSSSNKPKTHKEKLAYIFANTEDAVRELSDVPKTLAKKIERFIKSTYRTVNDTKITKGIIRYIYKICGRWYALKFLNHRKKYLTSSDLTDKVGEFILKVLFELVREEVLKIKKDKDYDLTQFVSRKYEDVSELIDREDDISLD